MEMLPRRGSDAEGLFHQTIWLVPVAILAFLGTIPVVVAVPSTIGCLACSRS
eukprot:TRINITY_DN22157_c0_g1_i1.p2 TRINITY_DN22157_c0_g1~~TRINITY_DN22157_c0_g1_i1.p2  ORF type:complete len:52 (-),score=1.60 TRINITY_DN22157_c0_g1_i1:27-182(-)